MIVEFARYRKPTPVNPQPAATRPAARTLALWTHCLMPDVQAGRRASIGNIVSLAARRG